MRWTIWKDKSGLICAEVDDGHPGFNEALADAISSLSPVGQPPALSTYWIEIAAARAALRLVEERVLSMQDGFRTLSQRLLSSGAPGVRRNMVSFFQCFSMYAIAFPSPEFGSTRWSLSCFLSHFFSYRDLEHVRCMRESDCEGSGHSSSGFFSGSTLIFSSAVAAASRTLSLGSFESFSSSGTASFASFPILVRTRIAS